MRLLNTKTLELKYFAQSPEEAYAILSHTWGEDEVLFSDAENLSSGLWNSWSLAKTLSAEKIRAAAALAASRRFRYIWVDTCCIDKSSSTELSEAVNSMFKWYQAARICFAYLSDVNPPEESQTKGVSFQNARWFSRGWTLQELIAPPEVEFYDAEWKLLGDRSSLVDVIHHTTKVHRNLLRPVRPRDWYSWYPSGPVVDEYPVSEIFIWAKSRETTRGEDIAYCLMGLFGVNMPLLYGEGKENALLRLQRNIISSCNDHSILLHADSAPLAKSLSEFNYVVEFEKGNQVGEPLLQATRTGIQVELLLHRFAGQGTGTKPFWGDFFVLAILDVVFSDDPTGLSRPAIRLVPIRGSGDYSKLPGPFLKTQFASTGEVEVFEGERLETRIRAENVRRTTVSIINMRPQYGPRRSPFERLILGPIVDDAVKHKWEYDYMRCLPQPCGNVIGRRNPPLADEAPFAAICLRHLRSSARPVVFVWKSRRGILPCIIDLGPHIDTNGIDLNAADAPQQLFGLVPETPRLRMETIAGAYTEAIWDGGQVELLELPLHGPADQMSWIRTPEGEIIRAWYKESSFLERPTNVITVVVRKH